MDDYNRYVTAVNKIFDYLEKMKAGWNNIDNKNYIESVEDFKSVVTSKADLMKQPPTVKVDRSKVTETSQELMEAARQEQPSTPPPEQVPVQNEIPSLPQGSEEESLLAQDAVSQQSSVSHNMPQSVTVEQPLTSQPREQEVVGIPELPTVPFEPNLNNIEELGQ